MVCFYTGREPGRFSSSVEHLLAKAHLVAHARHDPRFAELINDPRNRVVADARINNLIGNAPLAVKLDLRKRLHAAPPRATDAELLERAQRHLACRRIWLADERRPQWPWAHRCHGMGAAARRTLYAAWRGLLSAEERALEDGCADVDELIALLTRSHRAAPRGAL